MAICKRPGLFGFFLSTTFLILASTLANAQCMGSNPYTCTVTQSVSISDGAVGSTYVPPNVYPSTLSVSGLTGTIETIEVQLNGLNSDTGNQGNGTANLEVLLQAPNGAYMEIMGDAGNPGNPEIWNGVTLTIQDGATTMPYSGDTPCTNTGNTTWADQNATDTSVGTYAPTSCPFGNNPQDFPSPGPGTVTAAADLAAPVGTATLNGKFDGLTPNGTWNLYLVDNDGQFAGFDTIAISGWSLVLTLNETESSTTTSLNTNLNPSFTSGSGSSVTLTATVTGTPTPSGGTVAFKDGANTISCSGGIQVLSNQQATCVTTFTTQGNHVLTAVYSGSGSFAGSTSPPLNEFVETPTTGTYCNAGGITMPGVDNTQPYPSVINVPNTVTNAVATVSVTLTGFSWNEAAEAVHLLLVSPDSKALEFFSASTDATSGTYMFDDSGTQAPQETAISPGSYQPTVFTTGDLFTPQPPLPAPQVPGTFKIAAPVGTSTFENTFNGATASGAWSLFVYDDDGPTANGSITGGWCLDITQASGAATTTTVAATPNPSLTGVSVTVTATVKSGGNPASSGTVTFTENGQNIAGGPTSPVTLDGSGQASFTTTTLPEGDHNILATYNGVANTYALSFGNVTQRVDSTTTNSTNSGVISYCNPGTITIPSLSNPSDEGQASPNPSNIFVTGAPGTIKHVTISLNGVQLSTPYYLTSLLVGPLQTTADSLDFFSDVGGSTPMTLPVNVTLDDTAASSLGTGSVGAALETGSFKPTSGNLSKTDTFFASPEAVPFYTPPAGPYDYAEPAGSSTLAGTFDSQNPNGIWSLYLNQDNFAANSSISSWCVNLTENPPVLTITKSHVGSFNIGQTDAQYTITVSNSGPGSTGSASGPVTVTDNLPTGMTATAATGTDWSCTTGTTVSCTNSDAVAANGSYAPITVTVTVGSNTATGSDAVSNVATASGGGAAQVQANDPTTIISPPALSVAKSHSGNFTQGQTGSWTIIVSNTATGTTTSGTVMLTDTLPAGYTVSSAGGTNWSCSGTGTNSLTCSDSTDAVAGGSPFPTITLTVNVPTNSPTSVQNAATASGGGALQNATSPTDTVTVVQVPYAVNKAAGSSPQSTGITAAFTNPLSVTVLDANSVPIPSYNVVFTAPASGASGTFSNFTNTITVPTNDLGVANAGTFTASSTAGGPYNVSATAGPASTNFSLTNNPGGAASITVTQGSGQSATINMVFGTLLEAVVKDSGNNPVPNVSVTFTAPASGASGHFANSTNTTTVNTDANGLATATTFTANNTAGSYMVSAAAAGDGSTNFSLTNNPGTATSITTTAGSGQSVQINNAFATLLKATVTDNYSNPVPNVSVTFTAPATGASGKFANNTATTSVNTDSSGVATATTFTANSMAGSYTVQASTAGVASPANFSLTNTPGGAASITVTQGSGQSTQINMPFGTTLQAVVKDSSNNPVPSVSVTFTAPASGASGLFANNTNATTVNTDANGLATATTFTANSTAGGPYLVTAAAAGDGSTTFSLTNLHGNPYSITATAGSGQSANINTAFTSALQAVVKDSGGNVVPGVNVTFTAPASGASGTFPGPLTSVVVPTDATGTATAPTFTANSVTGSYSVSASTAGVVTPASFSLANINPVIITVNPMSLNFDDINLGSTKSMSLTVKNVSSANMKITNITFNYGPGAGKDFGYTTQCGGTIKPGKTCTITVEMHAQDLGAGAAILNIFYNGVGSPVQVGLMGNVINPRAKLNKSSLSFGSVKVGKSATGTVTLTSNGDTPLLLNYISISGPSNFTESNDCPASLAPTDACTITVTFAPTAKKSLSGTLKISDNASSSPQTVSLSGKGD